MKIDREQKLNREIVYPGLTDFVIDPNNCYFFDNYGGLIEIPSFPLTLQDVTSVTRRCTEYAYEITKRGKKFASLCLFTAPTGDGKDTVVHLFSKDRINHVSDLSRPKILTLSKPDWEKARQELLDSGEIKTDPLMPFPNEELIKIDPMFRNQFANSILNGDSAIAQKPAGTYFYNEEREETDIEREFGHKIIPDLIKGNDVFSSLNNENLIWSVLVGIKPSPQISMVFGLYRSLIQMYGDDLLAVNKEVQPNFMKLPFETFYDFKKAQAGGGIRGINRTTEAILRVGNYLWSKGILDASKVSSSTWKIISKLRPQFLSNKEIIKAGDEEMREETCKYIKFVSVEKKYQDGLWARGILAKVLGEVLTVLYQSEFLVGEFLPKIPVQNRPLITLIATNSPNMELYENFADKMRWSFSRKPELLDLLNAD